MLASDRPRQREQVVHDRQFGLRDDREVVLEEQVVVDVNAAADRVLDGQQPCDTRPSATEAKTCSNRSQAITSEPGHARSAAASLYAPDVP